MRRRRCVWCVVAVVLAGFVPATASIASEPPVSADEIAMAQLDGFALGLEQAGQFSGVVLVAQDGRVLFEKAYGRIDENDEARNTPDTRFNLASAGKMFTVVAVLQQVAKGRLTLDTRVGEVLPDYPNEAFASTVTVRHLLTHTAGAGGIDLFGAENAEKRKRVNSVADMLALHHDRAPEFPPGSKQEYGNFGHVVLGRIVEVVSGLDYEHYIRRYVLEPADMRRTGFVDCDARAPDIAAGYATVEDTRVLNCVTQPARGFPAGGQVSTAGDMFQFVQALLAEKLLPKALFEEAIKPQHEYMGLGFFATGYGPGWSPREFRWGHAGSSDGVCTDVRTYPVTGETVIALSNSEPPACFTVANFLHEQWDERAAGAAPQRDQGRSHLVERIGNERR